MCTLNKRLHSRLWFIFLFTQCCILIIQRTVLAWEMKNEKNGENEKSYAPADRTCNNKIAN